MYGCNLNRSTEAHNIKGSANTEINQGIQAVAKSGDTDTSFHINDKMPRTTVSGDVCSTSEDSISIFNCDYGLYGLSLGLHCQEDSHQKAVSKEDTLKTAELLDEDIGNCELNGTDHKRVCCNVSGGERTQLKDSPIDHISIDKSNKARCHLCNKNLPSMSNVEEHVQGHRHKRAQEALCAAQVKDKTLECPEAVVGQSRSETKYKKGLVREELPYALNSFVASSVQICEKDLHTAPEVDVEGHLLVSDPVVQVQQETRMGGRGRKQEYEGTEFQNILSLGSDSFLCDVCQETLVGYISVEQHVIGKKHAKNLAITAVNIENLWKKVRELEGGRKDNILMTSLNKFRCKLCCKKLDVTGVVSHVGGSTHQQKLDELKEKTGINMNMTQKWIPLDVHHIWNEAEKGKCSNICHTSGETFHCQPCKIMLSVEDVAEHVLDELHQEAIRAPENIQMNETLIKYADNLWQMMHDADRTHQVYFKIDSATALYCTSCCVRVPATVTNVTDHIRGKPHMTTVIKYLISRHPSMPKQRNSSNEENLLNHEATQALDLPRRRLKVKSDSVTSRGLLNSKSSQYKISKSSGDAQQALVKALIPRKKESSGQSASILQEKPVIFQCLLCDIKVESEELWNQHTCSQNHIIRAGKLMKEGKDLFSCSRCGVQSDSVKHICQNKKNEIPTNVPNEIAGNAQELRDTNTYKSLHHENMTHEEQANKPDYVPRIVVSGYPKNLGMEMLYSFFKDFGTVSFVAITGESAVIEFIENEAVKKALARPLFLGEAALSVKTLSQFSHLDMMPSPGNLSADCGRSGSQVPKPAISLHGDTESAFASLQSFETQLDALCKISNSMSSPKKGRQLCQFLEKSLASIFPGCKALPFGSRVSGLASNESDMDVFLDTGGMYEGRHRQEADVQELIVSVTENALQARPECCKVEGVPKARTPIVKFFHNPSETQCDLAFRHGLGCENTKLFKFYLSLDPRVRPVIIFLKHWAHLHKLTEQCNITNYALAWLVIFYLQQASGFGLPPVEFLQRLYEGPVKNIAGWECSFIRDKLKIPPIKSSQTVLQLLHGFFMYYNNFDFSKNVVCPLIGLPVHKNLFVKSPQNLPNAMDSYVYRIMKDRHAERFRTQCCMCVQDPFDLSHNVTKGTSPTVLQKFKILCRLTGDLCAKINS